MFKMGQFVKVYDIRVEYGQKTPVWKMVQLTGYRLFIMRNMQRPSSLTVFFFPGSARGTRARPPLGRWVGFHCTRHQWTINMHVTIHSSVGAAAHKRIKNNPRGWCVRSLLLFQRCRLQCPTCAWQKCNRDPGTSPCEHVSEEHPVGASRS